jgi:Polyketide cyclase / dehydrase and lipid transport
MTDSMFIPTLNSSDIAEQNQNTALLKGEILLAVEPHSAWGGAVTARMYLPMKRAIAWQKLTHYPNWVSYFPAMTHSEVIPKGATEASKRAVKRLYQVASKNFYLFTAKVEVYLKVIETTYQRIQFHLESGSFNDFSADLKLQDYGDGTLLTYSVKATPTIPVPSLFIQQAIQADLPANMRNMRQEMCR